MERKVYLMVLLLISVPFLSLTATGAQSVLVDAGPDQRVYVGQPVTFNGSVTANASSIVSIQWNFDDGSPVVNGSDPALLNSTAHTYAVEGVYNVTLSVELNSVLNTTETDTVKITVVQNLPPVADAGPDQIVEQTSPAGAEVTLNASGSYDPDDDPLTYNWTWTSGSATGISPTTAFPAGTTTVTLTVGDGQFTSTDTVNITVHDTTPPTVDAGADATVEQESHEGTEVTLNGNATDAASASLDFIWSEDGVVLGNEANLTHTFNLGVHVLTLNVTDASGNTGFDTVTVTVVDTRPPELTVSVTPEALWSPNHEYVEVAVTVTASDICDPAPTITIVSVTSNEPDNGTGDGNTVDDIVIVDNFTFNLRAERAGTGSGRTYTITYRATDRSGNSAQASATVTVAHNQ